MIDKSTKSSTIFERVLGDPTDGIETEESEQEDKNSLQAVRNDLQTMLDMMGPETPQFQTPSTDSSMSTAIAGKGDKLATGSRSPGTDSKNTSVIADFQSSYTMETVDFPNYDFLCNNKIVTHDPRHDGFYPALPCPAHSGQPEPPTRSNEEYASKRRNLLDWLRVKSPGNIDYYKMKVKQRGSNTLPKRLVFELADEIPKPLPITAPRIPNISNDRFCNYCNCGGGDIVPKSGKPDHPHLSVNEKKCACEKNRRLPKEQPKSIPGSSRYVRSCGQNFCGLPPGPEMSDPQRDKEPEKVTSEDVIICGDRQKSQRFIESGPTRVDVYYFDHGNSSYFRTTDITPVISTQLIAEKTETYTLRFWAEVFGTVHIGVSFVTSFILQFYRFFLFCFVRSLLIGILQLTSDYLVKPFLSSLFNALLQPLLIFLLNTANSVKFLCVPIAESVGFYLKGVATLFKAFRLVEVYKTDHSKMDATSVGKK